MQFLVDEEVIVFEPKSVESENALSNNLSDEEHDQLQIIKEVQDAEIDSIGQASKEDFEEFNEM